jgi:hypothetical protein
VLVGAPSFSYHSLGTVKLSKILHGLRGVVFRFCGRRVIVPVPEKTITAAFAYKLFTTLHLMVCKFQIYLPTLICLETFFI